MKTIQLQGVGHVEAVEAGTIKAGDVRMYNFGSTNLIIKVIDKTDKTITIITAEQTSNGVKYYMSDIRKTSLVAIVKHDQDVSMHNPKEAYNVSGRNKGMVDVSEYFQVEQTEEEKLEVYHLELQERGINLTASKPEIKEDATYKVIVSKDRENNQIGEFEKVVSGKELSFQLFMNEVLEIIEEIHITEPYFNTNHTIMNLDFWNDEETEKTNYTLIDFSISRFRISFNNDTKEAESIHLLPVVLHKNAKEYKLSTDNYEAKRALKEAIKIYQELINHNEETNEIQLLRDELKEIDNQLNKGVDIDSINELKVQSAQLRIKISKSLEQLFHIEGITGAQNARINMLLNEWNASDKYKFISLYTEGESIILHVTCDNSSDLYLWFDKYGVRTYSKGHISSGDKLVLIHDFNNSSVPASSDVTVNDDITAATEESEQDVSYVHNKERNSIEITFSEKPNEEIRSILKANRFRWARTNGVWYKKNPSEKDFIFVESLGASKNLYNSGTLETLATYPEIELTPIESYSVPQSITDREYEANWIFRQSKRDNTKELQEFLFGYQKQVLDVISTTDDVKIIHDLKRSLEYFKKHYSETYVSYLTVKGNNVNWAVSGRGNYNFRKAEKLNNRQDKLTSKLLELKSEMEKRILKAKKQIKKLQQEQSTVAV